MKCEKAMFAGESLQERLNKSTFLLAPEEVSCGGKWTSFHLLTSRRQWKARFRTLLHSYFCSKPERDPR